MAVGSRDRPVGQLAPLGWAPRGSLRSDEPCLALAAPSPRRPQSTVYLPQFTVHRPTVHRPTVRRPQSTFHRPQSTFHSSQFTVHRPTVHRPTVHPSTVRRPPSTDRRVHHPPADGLSVGSLPVQARCPCRIMQSAQRWQSVGSSACPNEAAHRRGQMSAQRRAGGPSYQFRGCALCARQAETSSAPPTWRS